MGQLNPLYSKIRDFLTVYLVKERKYSDNTVRSYKKAIDMILDYIELTSGVDYGQITFELINRDVIVSFLNYLEKERNCSAKTRNHRLNALRAFFKYSAREDVVFVAYYNEISKIKPARTEETLVAHMSEEVVEIILKQPNTTTDLGKRDAFLLLFPYKTGAHVQEVVDVKLCDIKLGTHAQVILHGKGGKSRAIPLRADVTVHLKNYLERFHPEESLYSSQYLFFTVRHRAKSRMTEQNVRNMVRKYGISARTSNLEVPENVHPHLFRHSWAMALYQHGVDLALISQWLGHSNISTTRIYAHADTEMKRRAIEKAIPEGSLIQEHINSERYKLSDKQLIRKLCGLE